MLITCIKASDFSGKLPKAVLDLMANFVMTEKVAENFEVVRKRLAVKGDDEVKQLLKEDILEGQEGAKGKRKRRRHRRDQINCCVFGGSEGNETRRRQDLGRQLAGEAGPRR